MSDPLQDPAELSRFIDIIQGLDVRSFLEIGSKYGGTLRAVAKALPKGSLVVSVDLPNGTKAWRESSVALQQTILDLQSSGHNAHLVWGDSADLRVVRKVTALGPFDCVFIDANHTRPFVERDWANYGVAALKVCAFHDISWRRAAEWVGTRIDVPEFWVTIKGNFRHEEIRLCPTRKNNGIGVLYLGD